MVKPCPCGSGNRLEACCLPYVREEHPAPDAQALMRARYTAYTLGCTSFLLNSWHPSTRPKKLPQEVNQKWIGLKIVATEAGSQEDATGEVEFVARYKVNGRAHRLAERSRFVRSPDGAWLYLDGKLDLDG
jgi:SEC-C motif-containing protein